MKKFYLAGLLFALAAIHTALAGEANNWTLSSPGERCAITVSLGKDGRLSYQTFHHGKMVVEKSPLGLRRDDQDFEESLIFDNASETKQTRETYDLLAGPNPHIDHLLARRSLAFRNANNASIIIELAASDEGVAFRYRFPESSSSTRTVLSENTGFNMAASSIGWIQPYHAAGPYTPAYEDFYFRVTPGDRPPNSRQVARGWAFPALFNVPGVKVWVLLTESGTDESYCACHLAPDCAGGLYQIAFPLADETTRGYTNKTGPEPHWTLPWSMPWRVLVMGFNPGDIALQSLVTDLAPPSRIADTSWIKPGRASWAWWSYPDSPATEQLFDQFTDFAAKMGWEYTLFDAGWWTPGLTPISSYAIRKGVVPLAWNYAGDFYDPKKRSDKLDQMQSAGIKGVKVDFWCSDRQDAIAAQQALMRDAAERKMVVNLHGCTIPRGWQRTWPNFLSCEAVLGSESYFYEPHYTEKAAELDTVLPFTRNAVGPMDLTPVACSPKKFERTTTAAHQLASALIFTCGIVHYADSPEFFESLPPDVLQIFRDAPARWDETRCLFGIPGQIVVFARRAGSSWYIAGINGTPKKQPVHLNLSDFNDFPKRFAVVEGKDAKMEVAVVPVAAGQNWAHDLPPRGGFILRLDK